MLRLPPEETTASRLVIVCTLHGCFFLALSQWHCVHGTAAIAINSLKHATRHTPRTPPPPPPPPLAFQLCIITLETLRKFEH